MAYTTISKSTDYFNTKLYTGNGSSQSFTGVGFQPDFTWIKRRGSAEGHSLFDAVRGVQKRIVSNDDGNETTIATSLTAFGSDGFTLGGNDTVNGSDTYASWNWKAGTAISGATVGLGTLKTYTGSVNTTAGFSVIKYTGNGTAGHQFPHGLGVAPKMIMVKLLSGTSNWRVYHASQGATKEGLLDTSDAFASASTTWNNSAPNSNSMPLGTNTGTNGNDSTYVAYCFAEKTGFSKFGTYRGNITTDNTFIYTGFAPAFWMMKNTADPTNWMMFDSKRRAFNETQGYPLNANETNAEDGGATGYNYDFLSNGIKIRGSNNNFSKDDDYIYMAFASAPLVGSNNIPCTAR